MSEQELKNGHIAPRDIVEEMEESYLNYSMSVIVVGLYLMFVMD